MAYGAWRSHLTITRTLIIPILSRINPIPRIDTYLRASLILSSHLGLPKGLLLVGVPAKTFGSIPSSNLTNVYDFIAVYNSLQLIYNFSLGCVPGENYFKSIFIIGRIISG